MSELKIVRDEQKLERFIARASGKTRKKREAGRKGSLNVLLLPRKRSSHA